MGSTTRRIGILATALASAAVPEAARAGHATAQVQTYNAALIQAANGAFTVTGAMAPSYIADSGLEAGSTLTVTLPDTLRFASVPMLEGTVNGVYNAVTTTVVTGGTGTRSVTYRLNGAVKPGGTLALGSTGSGVLFNVENGLGLAVPTAAPLPLIFEAGGNTVVTRNDRSPVTVPAFASSAGVALGMAAQDVAIDVGSPSLATEFVAGTKGTTTAAYLGLVRFGVAGGTLTPSGIPFQLYGSDAADLTVTGAFAHVAAAYLDPSDGTCDAMLPEDAIAAAVSADSLAFTGVAPDVGYGLCVAAGGQMVLQANPPGTMRLSIAGAAHYRQATLVDTAA